MHNRQSLERPDLPAGLNWRVTWSNYVRWKVTGGTPPVHQPPPATEDRAGFAFEDCATLRRLQGEWTPVRIVRDGQELPAGMLAAGLRAAAQNQVKITFGGKVMIHALVRID